MAKPKRTFSGQEGQRSVGTAGPEGISYDLDNLFAALDPDDTFKDGTPGGVGEENLRTGAISDRALGERTVDQSKSPSSNTGLLTNVLSWFGNMIKKITGETNWFDTPATTLKAAKTHIDANAPHSGHINAINNIQGGNITLKAGANVAISQNTATKEITIATSGTIAPSSHASSHAIGGADTITPAMIGAALASHGHPWGDITGKPSSFTPSSHTHPWSQVTSAPATATRWPSWSEVTSKPSTFTPSSHTHSKSDVGLSNVKNEEQATKSEFTSRLDSNDVAIGIGATASGSGGSAGSTAVGRGSAASGTNSVALGNSSEASGTNSAALGTSSKASGTSATALGRLSIASGDYSIALGYGSEASETGATALGRSSVAAASNEISLGNQNAHVKVPGGFTVQGTKNFEIPHPNPDKKSTHVLRHGAVESPTAGDTLYRYKVQSENNNEIVKIELPDYFIHLNKNVQIFVTPQGHFGQAYGSLNREDETLEITCQYAGEYNVLVIGTRNDDHESVQTWDIKGVEREVGESWLGETLAFEVNEIMEVEEIKEVN